MFWSVKNSVVRKSCFGSCSNLRARIKILVYCGLLCSSTESWNIFLHLKPYQVFCLLGNHGHDNLPLPNLYSHATGFGPTIFAGGLLALLNLAILAATVLQWQRRRKRRKQKAGEAEDISISTFSKSVSSPGSKAPPAVPPERSTSFHGPEKRLELLEDEISV